MSDNSETTILFDKKNLRPTIGVIKNNRVSYREMLQNEGLKHAARKNDVNLIIYSGGIINYQDELESTAIYDFVDTNKLDGLIIWTGNINWASGIKETERFVYKYNYLPIMSLEAQIDGVTSIVWDDFNAMRYAIIHLIEVHKYRRIAFIRGVSKHTGVVLRYKAYLHVLEEYGIPIDEDIIFDESLCYNDDGMRKFESMCMSGIDAIVAYNDLTAKFATMLMEKRNIPLIPIIGFDDEVEGEEDKPSLTTVHPPFYEMGTRAIDVILAKIKGEQVPELEVLRCRLIVRQSCGCIAGSVMKKDIYIDNDSIHKVPEITKNMSSVEVEKNIKDLIDIPEYIDISWVSSLFSLFIDEVKNGQDQGFVNFLEKLLIQMVNQNNSLKVFQDIIFLLYYSTDLVAHDNRDEYIKAQNILRQATNLIVEMQVSSEINKKLQEDRRYLYIISFKHIISNAVDMNDLIKRIKIGFKMIGISSCYLSLYENRGNSTDKARLTLAYDEETCMGYKP